MHKKNNKNPDNHSNRNNQVKLFKVDTRTLLSGAVYLSYKEKGSGVCEEHLNSRLDTHSLVYFLVSVCVIYSLIIKAVSPLKFSSKRCVLKP